MTTEGYRNKPQFNYDPVLNKNITPNVPDFNSNAMDNDEFVQLTNGSNSGYDKHDEEYKNHNRYCNHK